jgi:uncharacterized protein
MPEGAVQSIQQSLFDQLDAAFFDALSERSPQVVILGTGPVQRFPHPRLFSGLSQRSIGVESMTTAAAVRTYNILMAEGRQVLGAFIVNTLGNQ